MVNKPKPGSGGRQTTVRVPSITINIDKLIINSPPWAGQPTADSLRPIKEELDQIMATVAELTQAVTDETTIEQSAITLINGLIAQVTAAQTDPVALQAAIDSMKASSTALAAAVAAGTPAAPAP